MGYLRDVRRLTVALSRARLGLYILGRREVFESCPELQPAFDILLKRPDKLMLVTGELWPSQRLIAEEAVATPVDGETPMEGVEHLGQYVYEMTNSKVQQLRAERGIQDDIELATVNEEVESGMTVDDEETAVPQEEFEAEDD